ncbi:MAG: hypothetical protein ACO1N7_08075 [Sphingobacteriaceae bacterium]
MLLLFVMLLGSFALPKVYAFNNGQSVSDSIRKVNIRVVALEKPKVADLDSLLLSSMPAKVTKKVFKKTISKQESIPVNISSESSIETFNTDQQAVESDDSFTEPKQVEVPKTAETKVQADEVRNTELTDNPATFQEVKTARTYLWIGFMLIVVGIILGILFGKTALLVSIAGVVFVAIGYIIQH